MAEERHQDAPPPGHAASAMAQPLVHLGGPPASNENAIQLKANTAIKQQGRDVRWIGHGQDHQSAAH
jgi:hypothetical protein